MESKELKIFWFKCYYRHQDQDFIIHKLITSFITILYNTRRECLLSICYTRQVWYSQRSQRENWTSRDAVAKLKIRHAIYWKSIKSIGWTSSEPLKMFFFVIENRLPHRSLRFFLLNLNINIRMSGQTIAVESKFKTYWKKLQ